MDMTYGKKLRAERLSKLPKWAQTEIKRLDAQIDKLEFEKKKFENMLRFTEPDMEWYIVDNSSKDFFDLFRLCENNAQHVVSVGPRDKLFIGRAKK